MLSSLANRWLPPHTGTHSGAIHQALSPLRQRALAFSLVPQHLKDKSRPPLSLHTLKPQRNDHQDTPPPLRVVIQAFFLRGGDFLKIEL